MPTWNDNPFSMVLQGIALESFCDDQQLLTTKEKPVFAWVDIETTGLDPEKDVSLEMGIMLTDAIGNVCGAANWLIWREETFESVIDKSWLKARATADTFVLDMHRKSGLWLAVDDAMSSRYNHSYLHPEIVAADARLWVQQMCGDGVQLQLSGSTPHFDRGFLRRDLPQLENWFHYRSGVDVSGIREVAKRVCPTVVETQPVKREVHRPLPDLGDSIRLYRHMLRTFLFTTESIREALG